MLEGKNVNLRIMEKEDLPLLNEWTNNLAFLGATNGTGSTTTHTFASPGNYTVTLTVKDAAGNTNTDTLTITALTPPPIIPMWAVGAAIVAIGITVTILLWRKRKT